MMAGNPNWWAMFPPSFNSFADQPQSWSQLLLGDEDRVLNQTQMSHYQPKKLENWEEHILNNNNNNNNTSSSQLEASNFVDNITVKQQVHSNNNILHPTLVSSHHTNKFLDFSSNTNNNQHHNTDQLPLCGAGAHPDHSLESSKDHSVGSTGGACKKARVHPPSSSQPPLKVRKEKLVDRITALHQIVSPFGKTDTASVLSEAIGYIRFLQGQIEALSYPYLQNAPKDIRNSQPMHFNDSCLKRKVTPNQGEEMMKNEEKRMKDLRSKGLCLVPLSCTHLVGADNNHNNINNNIAASYWSPAYGSTSF